VRDIRVWPVAKTGARENGPVRLTVTDAEGGLRGCGLLNGEGLADCIIVTVKLIPRDTCPSSVFKNKKSRVVESGNCNLQ